MGDEVEVIDLDAVAEEGGILDQAVQSRGEIGFLLRGAFDRFYDDGGIAEGIAAEEFARAFAEEGRDGVLDRDLVNRDVLEGSGAFAIGNGAYVGEAEVAEDGAFDLKGEPDVLGGGDPDHERGEEGAVENDHQNEEGGEEDAEAREAAAPAMRAYRDARGICRGGRRTIRLPLSHELKGYPPAGRLQPV